MKRLLFLALPVVALAACGTSTDITASKAPAATQQPTTQQPTTEKPTTPAPPTTAPKPTTTPAPPTTRAPRVSDSFTATDTFIYPSSSYWYFGAVLANTGTKPIQDVQIDVEAYDDAGRLVDSTTDYAKAVLPGVPYVIKTFTDVGQPTRVEVKLTRGSFSPSATWGALEIANLNFEAARYSSKVTGEIHSTFSEDQDYVQVFAIWKDPGTGAIIAVDETAVDKVYSGQVSAFSIGVFDDNVQRMPDLVVAQFG